jgi:hypothetical protein
MFIVFISRRFVSPSPCTLTERQTLLLLHPPAKICITLQMNRMTVTTGVTAYKENYLLYCLLLNGCVWFIVHFHSQQGRLRWFGYYSLGYARYSPSPTVIGMSCLLRWLAVLPSLSTLPTAATFCPGPADVLAPDISS